MAESPGARVGELIIYSDEGFGGMGWPPMVRVGGTSLSVIDDSAELYVGRREVMPLMTSAEAEGGREYVVPERTMAELPGARVCEPMMYSEAVFSGMGWPPIVIAGCPPLPAVAPSSDLFVGRTEVYPLMTIADAEGARE